MKVRQREFLYLMYLGILNTNGKWFSGPQHKPWNNTEFSRLSFNISSLNAIPTVHINQMAKRCTDWLLTIKTLSLYLDLFIHSNDVANCLLARCCRIYGVKYLSTLPPQFVQFHINSNRSLQHVEIEIIYCAYDGRFMPCDDQCDHSNYSIRRQTILIKI